MPTCRDTLHTHCHKASAYTWRMPMTLYVGPRPRRTASAPRGGEQLSSERPGDSCSSRRSAGLALTALAALLLIAPAAHAQWKWRDERGQIHASDLPPPRTVPDKDVLQRPPPVAYKASPAASAASAAAPTAAPTAKLTTDPALEEKKRQAEQAQAAQKKAEETKLAAQRKDNCTRARDQLATLESGQRIARIDANGNREFLSDEQRAQESQRARALMSSDCR